ncbi:PfkB family carbohydrate kinase [Herbidospora mongoliensis]|uniref:PfkB family carbohydrate kinase n=1 Tax=Herbidospora mongoliensis TaxID=688067 RepID=UPI000833B0DC|nr:PfkB family carbohydrate kinase [Herbidospora mongoliensis]
MTEETVRRFPGLTAVVVGDVMLDSWLQGRAGRMAQEAPVPVVSVEQIDDAPGGAANTAANLAALGARVHLLGVAGADPAGTALIGSLLRHEVDGPIIARGRRTAVKRRVMSGGQMVARYDEEDRSPVTASVERELVSQIREIAELAHVVIVCDSGAGVCTAAVREALAGLPLLVVDAYDPELWRDSGPAAVLARYDACDLVADDPFDVTGAPIVITDEGDGAVVHREDRPPHRTHRASGDLMGAGAGDTFTAVFALALAAGADAATAADLAQAGSDVVSRRPGTAVCDADDLLAEVGPRPTMPAKVLAERVAVEREQGRRIVFTDGSFDVLHPGHVTCLEQARRLGDVLVVGVRDDASAARRKAPDRVVNTAEDRAAVLAGLGSVDYITLIEDDSPASLLRLIRPDFYVKGAGGHPDLVPEARLVRELGGEVRLVERR